MYRIKSEKRHGDIFEVLAKLDNNKET